MLRAWEQHEEDRSEAGRLFIRLHHVEGQLLNELVSQMVLERQTGPSSQTRPLQEMVEYYMRYSYIYIQ